jgi:hypothetical protein
VAVPSVPSVGSRAVYFPFATPAPVLLSSPQSPGGGAYTQPVAGTVLPPDIGNAGVPLPATVLSVSGSAPDYSGMQLLIYKADGTLAVRSANFAANQPMLNQATWTTNGSNPLQARWALVDALS